MIQVSQIDSPAFLYARFHIASAQALTDQGKSPMPQTVKRAQGGATLCNPTSSSGSNPCANFSNFTTDTDRHLLTGFTVDGKSIAERLARGGDMVSGGGARFSLLGAYRSVKSEQLNVVVEVLNGPAKIDIAYTATYVAPDGRQVRDSGTSGPSEVQPSAKALVAIRFAGVAPGGRLILKASRDHTPFEISLHV